MSTASLTARERIERTLRGEPVDRAPVATWRHHPRQEVTTDGLVEITVRYQREHNWDLVKINPRAEYHAEAWGNRYALYLDDHRRPTLLEHRITEPADFEKLEELDPEEGVLGEHLTAVRRIREQLGNDVPIVMTVFTPLSIAAELAGIRRENPARIFTDPEPLRVGLERITRTFEGFVRRVLEAGADGIFLATTRLGTRKYLTDEQFRAFSTPYDLRILQAASAGWFNILHVCGSQCMLDLTRDYPVPAYSWDMADRTNPGPELVAVQWCRVAIGGIDQRLMNRADAAEMICAQARDAWQRAGAARMVIAGGCVLPTDVRPENLHRLRQCVEQLH